MRRLLRGAAGDSDDLAYFNVNTDSTGIGFPKLTVDPAAIIGGEESNDASDVLGNSAALERAVLGHELLDLVRWPVWGAALKGSQYMSQTSRIDSHHLR